MRATTTTRTGPDARRRPTSRTHPSGRPSSHPTWTNRRGPVTLNRQTQYTYNDIGWLTTTTTPSGSTTTYSYDDRGNVVAVEGAEGIATAGYDLEGNRIHEEDASGVVATYEYDFAGRPTRVGRPSGAESQTVYDPLGHVLSQIDGLGNATSYGYDAKGRLMSMTDPLGRSTTFNRDEIGRVSSTTREDGSTIGYDYDTLGQLTAIDVADTTVGDISYEYDVLGNRVRAFTELGTVDDDQHFTFDALNRLTSHTSTSGSVISLGLDVTRYHYDLAGRVVGIEYPRQALGPALNVSRTYNAAGEMTAVTDWFGRTTTFDYDLDGRLTDVQYPNGVTTAQTFDGAGRLESILHRAGDAATPSDMAIELAYTYTRDEAGRVRSTNLLLPDPQVESVGYDADGRLQAEALAGVEMDSYSYDNANNLVSRSLVGTEQLLTYDIARQLETSTNLDGSTTTYSFDALGRRIHESPGPGTSLERTYTYDVHGRLTTVAAQGAQAIGFRYHADGLRADLQWDLSSSLPSIIGDDLAYYITGPTGLPLQRILKVDPQTLAGLSSLEAAQQSTWYHQDQLGSTVALSDLSGAFSAAYRYAAHGEAIVASDPSNPFQFAGQYVDRLTGLIYMRARWYDPRTAQFLTRDPIEHTTRQPYEYASNDPINRVDPTGLEWWNPATWTPVDNWQAGIGDLPGWLVEHRNDVLTGATLVAYATCPWTAGTGCVMAAWLTGPTLALAAYDAVHQCNTGTRTDCVVGSIDMGLAYAGSLADGLTLTGKHFSQMTIDIDRAILGGGLSGLTAAASKLVHALVC